MQHIDVVIVEDTQGSPIDAASVQRIDVEEDPTQDQHASAWMEDVRMVTLDLGGEDNDAERI